MADGELERRGAAALLEALAFARRNATSVEVKRFSPKTVMVDLPRRARRTIYPDRTGNLGYHGELFRVKFGRRRYRYATTLEEALERAMDEYRAMEGRAGG